MAHLALIVGTYICLPNYLAQWIVFRENGGTNWLKTTIYSRYGISQSKLEDSNLLSKSLVLTSDSKYKKLFLIYFDLQSMINNETAKKPLCFDMWDVSSYGFVWNCNSLYWLILFRPMSFLRHHCYKNIANLSNDGIFRVS